jgi:predicted enzyme related to lactoylglutathione lyase
VQCKVHDMETAVAFYRDVFGFEVVGLRNGHALLQTPNGLGSLMFEAVSAADDVHITRFSISLVDPADLDRAVALAVAAGGRVVSVTEHAVGGATVVVADPIGNLITL